MLAEFWKINAQNQWVRQFITLITKVKNADAVRLLLTYVKAICTLTLLHVSVNFFASKAISRILVVTAKKTLWIRNVSL